ncbi:MAG: leucyl aminopeptidase [Stappiaceae bacterium]
MPKTYTISFAKPDKPGREALVVLAGNEGTLGPLAGAIDKTADGVLTKAMQTADYSGAARKILDIINPAGTDAERILIAGMGSESTLEKATDWEALGGAVMGALSSVNGKVISVLLENPDGSVLDPESAAAFAQGMKLRQYIFDRHKSDKDGDKNNKEKKETGAVKIQICLEGHLAAKKAFTPLLAIAEGVHLARDLVNEPANILGTIEFASEAKKLESLGVKVDILEEKDMQKLGMRALLGVSQGSVRPAKLVIMHWKGGKAKEAPAAFVGKGVVFDTGGISIKPAGGMEDMKGDMGGAAAVTGLMKALAGRKAKANVIGVIGLVENMPDADAQRPGDVVTSMSGQTIEVLNTDAEGRLVLADALWYTQQKFKPAFMIDLATLTGAVIIALGHHYAGLYSNDDELAADLGQAGTETAERVWRLPLDPDYDKIIDGSVGDVKNTGGRAAGSITAAQFLQRFVNELPWAHLDIAGTAFGSPKTEINKSWASGFGVRLLDRFVKNRYES